MIAREHVLHVARLARLELTSEEVERFAAQLAAIVEYVDQLRELDAAGDTQEPPRARGDEKLRRKGLRPDEPGATLAGEDVLALFPASDGEHLLVPPVLPARKGS